MLDAATYYVHPNVDAIPQKRAASDPWTTRSYKTEGGSAVYQTWIAAAASLTLCNLELSAIFVVEWRQMSCKEVHRFKPSIIRQEFDTCTYKQKTHTAYSAINSYRYDMSDYSPTFEGFVPSKSLFHFTCFVKICMHACAPKFILI